VARGAEERLMEPPAQRIVERFGLEPHPEGGWFRQVYCSDLTVEHPAVPAGEPRPRSAGTLIWFLLSGEQFSAFHRLRWTDEIWHFYAGAALEMHLIHPDARHEMRLLSNDIERATPATVIQAGCWQAARISDRSGWSFCGCSVAPGFEFADFEMPPAAALIADYPQLEAIIRELTRH
jgi:uncharacterized protein